MYYCDSFSTRVSGSSAKSSPKGVEMESSQIFAGEESLDSNRFFEDLNLKCRGDFL